MNKQKTMRKNPGYFESMKRHRAKGRKNSLWLPTRIDPRMTDFVNALESSGNLVFHKCFSSRYRKPIPALDTSRMVNFELHFTIRYTDKRFFSAVMESFCYSKYSYCIRVLGCQDNSVDVRITSDQIGVISELNQHLEFKRIINHVRKAIGKRVRND